MPVLKTINSADYNGKPCQTGMEESALKNIEEDAQEKSYLITGCNHRFSVAPMMKQTDRHCRFLMRLLSKRTVLYTEMITAQAIVHGDKQKLLKFNPDEHPLVLQIGGSDPELMAQSAQVAQSFGFDEVNINVGCPSDRVKKGTFGACLFLQPFVVARCIERMRQISDIPISVKTRIGVDDRDDYEDLAEFIQIVKQAGCKRFVIHARKAILSGLSPKQNREIPPLNYARVYKIKQAFRELEIIINGGIQNLDECQNHLKYVDGVMLGRAAYNNPYLLSAVDNALYRQDNNLPSSSSASIPSIGREQVVEQYADYFDKEIRAGESVSRLVKPLMGLYKYESGGRLWRRALSESNSNNVARILRKGTF